MTSEQLLILILRSFLTSAPLSVTPSFPEFEAVCRMAKRHDLSHIMYHVLEQNGCLPQADNEAQMNFLKITQRKMVAAQYRFARMEAELDRMEQVLSDAEIPFIPMKGSVLASRYPEPWARTRCDLDILVHESDLEQAAALIETLGYSRGDKREYHNIALTCNDVRLELHYTIMERHPAMDVLLEQVWDHTVSDGFRYTETPAFFRFHHIAHMAHHFLGGGCGARTLMDLWLLRHSPDHDEAATEALCEQSGLLTFYREMVRLSEVWFGGDEHDEQTLRVEQFILRGGSFGTQSQRRTTVSAAYSKRELIKRFLKMPYSDLKNHYPSLIGKKWLTPVYRSYHILCRLLQGRGVHAIDTIRAAGSQEEQVSETRDLLHTVGLL